MPNLTNIWFYNKCLSLKLSKNIFIAYSGGMDSTVLLNITNKVLKKKYKIRVINVEHCYSIKSNYWSNYCKKQCQIFKIPLYTIYLNYNHNIDSNLEKFFRRKRYKIFLSLINKGATLFLGHNNNDLIETFLLRLFKGAGLIGLSSIKEKLTLGKIKIIRPLLRICRKQISEYVSIFHFTYVSDNSNLQNKFDRNYIRNQIVPVINKKWMYSMKIVNKYSYSYYNMCKYFYKMIYNKLFLLKGRNIKILLINDILSYTLFLRNEIIRLWVKENNFTMLNFTYLNELDKMLNSNFNKNFALYTNEFIINRFKDYLYIINKNCYMKKNYIIMHDIYFYNLNYRHKDYILLNLNNRIYSLSKISKELKIRKSLYKYNIPQCERYNYFIIIHNSCLKFITGLWLDKTYKTNNKYNFLFFRLL